jgi:hypothetical protein
VTREEFVELVYRYGEACEQAQLTGADHKQAEGLVVAAFDAQADEATISYEALERQREATKAAEAEVAKYRAALTASVDRSARIRAEASAEVEALIAERDELVRLRRDADESFVASVQREQAAESSLAEVTRERDEEAANSRSKRLVVQSLREQLVTLESSLAEAVGALKEAESAMTWALDKSPEACQAMVKESAQWRIKARSILTKLAAKETK